MVRIAASACLVFVTAAAVFGQSGRRISAAEVPPTPKADSADIWSESKPVNKRPIYRRPVKDNKRTDKVAEPVPAATEPTVLPADEGDVIAVETNLVTIPVSVFDRNGLYIPNLRQQDFKVFEDGKEQEVTYFGTSEKPFTVVLLLDTSPSTEFRIDEIQDAAIAFVDQLKAQDRVMVIEFDQGYNVLTEPTGDRQQIYKAIRKADFGSGTSLYGAITNTLQKYLSKIEGRKAVVLFTDGVDTTSGRSTYDSTLALAEESDAMIFPIYYNTFSDTRRGINGGMIGFPSVYNPAPGTAATDYALGKQYLEDLAAYTGGRVFQPGSTPGGLTAAFEGIAEELRRQYVIGYIPESDGTPGQRKQIKVRVNRPNLVIRARDSYIVGSTTAAN